MASTLTLVTPAQQAGVLPQHHMISSNQVMSTNDSLLLVPPKWARNTSSTQPPQTTSTITIPSSQKTSFAKSSKSVTSSEGLVYLKSSEKPPAFQVCRAASVKSSNESRRPLADDSRCLTPSVSASVSVSESSAWDIKSGFLQAARTGPTGVPPHIHSNNQEFESTEPSPLLMYYYDESAPNDVLLQNDVLRASPTRAVRQKLKKLLTCDAGKERKYQAKAEEYSVDLDDELPLSTAEDYISQDSQPISGVRNIQQQQQPPNYKACGACIPGGRSGAEKSSIADLSSEYSSTYDEDHLTQQQQHLRAPDPVHRAVSQTSARGQGMPELGWESGRETSGCGQCGGSGVVQDQQHQARYCECQQHPRDHQDSYRDLARPSSLSGSEAAQTKSRLALCTCGAGAQRRSTPAHAQTASLEKSREGSISSYSEGESLSTTDSRNDQTQQERAFRPTEKRETDRDLGYHLRRMFFAAGGKDKAIDTEYQMCPTYSVSYKNYPYICYDAVVPTTYSDFFREKQLPTSC